jgi:hypothetical protein
MHEATKLFFAQRELSIGNEASLMSVLNALIQLGSGQ